MYADEVDPAEVGRQWLERMGWTTRRALAARERLPGSRERFVDVWYREALADPLSSIERIYDAFGFELTRETQRRMERRMAAAARDKAPAHVYSARQFGLTEKQIRDTFADYMARFIDSPRAELIAQAASGGSMGSHPIATPEQHAHEREALALTRHPVVRQAFERVRESWLAATDPSPDMRGCFDWAFEEVMFSAAVWSLNQDPLRPRVICITRLAHTLGDTRIPGSRWGIDNPDTIYRVIPISGSERYVIRGRVAERRLTENYFTLWDEKMNTIDVLSGHDLVLDGDRRFTICGRQRPEGRSSESHPIGARGARALHPRRDARLVEG